MFPERSIMPTAPPSMYKTYQIAMPLTTHFRPASCAEVNCSNYLNGWKTILPTNHPQVEFVRSLKGRYHFTESTDYDGEHRHEELKLITFVFPAGQQCFQASEHRISLERPALFIVKGGDFRGNPSGEFRQHSDPSDWVEDCALHLDKVTKDRE